MHPLGLGQRGDVGGRGFARPTGLGEHRPSEQEPAALRPGPGELCVDGGEGVVVATELPEHADARGDEHRGLAEAPRVASVGGLRVGEAAEPFEGLAVTEGELDGQPAGHGGLVVREGAVEATGVLPDPRPRHQRLERTGGDRRIELGFRLGQPAPLSPDLRPEDRPGDVRLGRHRPGEPQIGRGLVGVALLQPELGALDQERRARVGGDPLGELFDLVGRRVVGLGRARPQSGGQREEGKDASHGSPMSCSRTRASMRSTLPVRPWSSSVAMSSTFACASA